MSDKNTIVSYANLSLTIFHFIMLAIACLPDFYFKVCYDERYCLLGIVYILTIVTIEVNCAGRL